LRKKNDIFATWDKISEDPDLGLHDSDDEKEPEVEAGPENKGMHFNILVFTAKHFKIIGTNDFPKNEKKIFCVVSFYQFSRLQNFR
jgi:hypothetical protein